MPLLPHEKAALLREIEMTLRSNGRTCQVIDIDDNGLGCAIAASWEVPQPSAAGAKSVSARVWGGNAASAMEEFRALIASPAIASVSGQTATDKELFQALIHTEKFSCQQDRMAYLREKFHIIPR
jgi:hypothetical protein